jgi:hypothetical protein
MPITDNPEARSRCKYHAARKLMGPRFVASYQKDAEKTVVINSQARISPAFPDMLTRVVSS